MSDDRFKQARRSLMNQPQAGMPQYEDSEDATAMVDLNALQAGGPQFQPPPNYSNDYSQDEGATQLVDLNALQAGPPAAAPPPMSSGFGVAPADQSSGVMIGDGRSVADFEASTQFVNLDALQAGPPAAAPPMGAPPMGAPPVADYGAGPVHEGSTQFLDINALAAGQFSGPQIQASDLQPVEQDQALLNDFTFGTESIQRYGDITLIFATNKRTKKEVVLKRVWEGSPHSLPDELLSRIQLLKEIKHPKIAEMYGMLMAGSGVWAELQRPPGMRLTHILQQGPKDERVVAKWMKQVADGLQAVHDRSILYGSLTTDAVWLDEQTGKVMLEPFDVLVFENRGNLGVFGAPELNIPPQQRPVTPATDIYSFAAITLAAITGQVSPQALETLKNEKLKAALGAALGPDPTTRTTLPAPILQAMGGGGLDKRLLIPVAALVMVMMLVVVVMSMGGGGEGEQPAGPPVVNTPPIDPMSIQPRIVPPGEVQLDERLKIETSYQLNPPPSQDDDVVKEPTADDIALADKRLAEARDKFKTAKTAKKEYEVKLFKDAFIALTESSRLRGKMSSDDKELWDEIMENKTAREILGEEIAQVDKRLRNDGIVAALNPYRALSRMHPQAKAAKFFEKNNKAKTIVVSGKDDKPSDEEEESK